MGADGSGGEHDGEACTIGRRVYGIRKMGSRGRGIENGGTKGAGGGRVGSHGAGRAEALGAAERDEPGRWIRPALSSVGTRPCLEKCGLGSLMGTRMKKDQLWKLA